MDVILYDELKRVANLRKHQLDFVDLDLDLDLTFFEDATILPAWSGRLEPVDTFRSLPITVVFRPLGVEAISVISMRPAGRKVREQSMSDEKKYRFRASPPRRKRACRN